MKNVQSIIAANEICIVACVENFKTRKGEDYLNLWFRLEPWFFDMDVPVVLLTKESEFSCARMEAMYRSRIHFVHDFDSSFFKKHNVIKEKYVFGQKKEIVYPYVFIYVDNEMVRYFKRMSGKILENMYRFVLKIRNEKNLKKFKNMFDIHEISC